MEDAPSKQQASRLIANLTHELKTPLHSILTVAGLLAAETDGNLNDEQKRQVALIQRNGKQLLELITGLLQFSSSQTGNRKPKIERFDLSVLLNELVETLQPVADKGGVSLESDTSKLEPMFASDKYILSHIISNLLSNAVKFSPDGGTVSIYAESKADGSLFLQVVDAGIGMPPEVQQAIFQDFFQADGGDSRRFGGVGLGLSLVKNWVESLGGHIEVKSEPEKGSLFTLGIPSQLEVLSSTKICVVDSDPGIRLSLQSCFKQDGFEVVLQQDVSNLSQFVAEEQPDLVIMDTESKWEILEELRNLSNPKLLIIVMSVLDAPEERAKAFKLGANDFIVKPFDILELRVRVRSQLERVDE